MLLTDSIVSSGYYFLYIDCSFFLGFICQYIISKNKRHPRTNPLPFDIVVTDRSNGSAEIHVRDGKQLSYANHQFYKFGIVAEDCGSPPKRSRK